MARISGVDLPRGKKAHIALTYIFGIGPTSSAKILKSARVEPNKRMQDMLESEIIKLREIIEKEYRVEGDLRKEVAMNIKRLTDVGTYRGIRHRKGLPVRGQRTHTNARTRKGPRKAIGAKSRSAGKR